MMAVVASAFDRQDVLATGHGDLDPAWPKTTPPGEFTRNQR